MAYPKGKPRPAGSGRKKGSKNLITRDFHARLDELKFDPIAEAVMLFKTPEVYPDLKFRILVYLTEYTNFKPINPLSVKKGPEDEEPPGKERHMSDEQLEESAKHGPAQKGGKNQSAAKA